MIFTITLSMNALLQYAVFVEIFWKLNFCFFKVQGPVV